MNAANSRANFAVLATSDNSALAALWVNCKRDGLLVLNASGDVLFTLPVENLDDHRLQVPSQR